MHNLKTQVFCHPMNNHGSCFLNQQDWWECSVCLVFAQGVTSDSILGEQYLSAWIEILPLQDCF